MGTETAPPEEPRRGLLAQLRDGCLGEVVGIAVLAGFALLGMPIAHAIGIPEQKTFKDQLVVYGMIGLGAGAVIVVPVWLAARWIIRKRRAGAGAEK